MPEISRFYGMVITMYYNDHNPPHFHVKHGRQRCLVSIEEPKLLEGDLSRRALRMVVEWARQNKVGLSENWILARSDQPLNKIEPLE